MTVGLKPHTRQDRARIVAALAPLIQKHAGDDLIALAVAGSVARGNDGDYSDIELFAFVKHPPPDHRSAVKFIHDGILVDAWFLTRADYIDIFKSKVRLGNHPWPHVALNALAPVINAPFIEELKAMPARTEAEDFRRALTSYWPRVQEATGKFMNSVMEGNELVMMSFYWQMIDRMCTALSFLNERPYTTSATVYGEVLAFQVLPASFPGLMLKPNEAAIPSELARRAMAVFGELESMLQSRGCRLYAESLDAFVSPYSRRAEFVRRTGIGRIARKARKVLGRG